MLTQWLLCSDTLLALGTAGCCDPALDGGECTRIPSYAENQDVASAKFFTTQSHLLIRKMGK